MLLSSFPLNQVIFDTSPHPTKEKINLNNYSSRKGIAPFLGYPRISRLIDTQEISKFTAYYNPVASVPEQRALHLGQVHQIHKSHLPKTP